MGLFGGKKGNGGEQGQVDAKLKWDYINLSDFRTSNCFTVFSYIWLWMLVFVAISVYCADTFTAVKLLAFNQWSSQIQPKVPFEYSKWIFAGCIIASYCILIYDWQRAIRVMKKGGVAEDYLDPLAVQLQSIRFGSGWRRFLVFAKLTKSKKKMTWVALFVYFERKGAIRLLLADGPRQAINAMTLWAVVQADLIPQGANAAPRGSSPIAQFFINIKILATKNEMQTVILSTMAFTLIIWALSMLLLILAFLMYILVLWHQIPNETLTQFCRRKIETRLGRIVQARYEKMWAKEQAKQAKLDQKAAKRGETPAPTAAMTRKPTLPMLGGSPPSKTAEFTMQDGDSTATLPIYDSRPGTPAGSIHQPSLPNVGSTGRPNAPSRAMTQASNYSDYSYASNAPLLQEAARPGTSQSFRPPPLARSMTGSTTRTYGPPVAMPGHPARSNTSFSQQSVRSQSPFSNGPPSSYGPLSVGGASTTSPVDPYNQRHPSPLNGPSYEMAPVNHPAPAAYPGQRSYTPQSQNQRGPAPTSNPYAPGSYTAKRNSGESIASDYFGRTHTPQPNPMPRRDLSTPVSGGGNFAGPGPYNNARAMPPTSVPPRSATAPIPQDARQNFGPRRPLQRTQTFGTIPEGQSNERRWS